jgi:MFS transporter, DHA2 family, multidrug resistance protein
MWESISPTNNASGLFNLIRNEGSSIGVAVTTTLLQRHTQVHQMRLIEHVNPLATEALRRLGQLAGPGDPVAAAHRGLHLLYLQVQRQALLLSYLDLFRLFALATVVVIPLVLLMRRSVAKGGAAVH